MTLEELRKEIMNEEQLKLLESLPEKEREIIRNQLETLITQYHSSILEPLQKQSEE